MAEITGWYCKGCGWELGQVTNETLQIYAQAIHGQGLGAVPEVRTILAPWARSPVRCSHCGEIRVWDANLARLAQLLEISLARKLTETEEQLLYGPGG